MNKEFYANKDIFWLSEAVIIMWLRNNNEESGHFVLFNDKLRFIRADYTFEDISLLKNIVRKDLSVKSKVKKIEKYLIFEVDCLNTDSAYIQNKYSYEKSKQPKCLEFKLKSINKDDPNKNQKNWLKSESCGDFLIVFQNEKVLNIWTYLLEIFLDQVIQPPSSSTDLHAIGNTIYTDKIFDTIIDETLVQDNLINQRNDNNGNKNIMNPLEMCLKTTAVLVEPFKDEHRFLRV